MIQNLQWRVGIVVLVVLASLFLLYPSVGPVPAFWSKYLPANPIRLGLDLQGGLHLILEVQTEKAVETVVDQTMAEASAIMKENRIRYSDIRRTSSDSFAVYLKDPGQEPLFDRSVVDKLSNFKKLSAGQTDKGYEIRLGLLPKVVEDIKQQAVRQAIEALVRRNGVKPRGELPSPIEMVRELEEPHKRVLRHLLRVLRRAEHAPRIAIQPPVIAAAAKK